MNKAESHSMVAEYSYTLIEALRLASKKKPINEEIIIEIVKISQELINHGFLNNDLNLLKEYYHVPQSTYKLVLFNRTLSEQILNSYLLFFYYEISSYKHRNYETTDDKNKSLLLVQRAYSNYLYLFKNIFLDKDKSKDELSENLYSLTILVEDDHSLFENKHHLLDSLEQLGQEEKDKYIINFYTNNYLGLINRQSGLALRAWAYMLFHVNVIDINLLRSFLKVSTTYHDINDFLFDLLPIIKNEDNEYLGLSRWDYRDTKEEGINYALSVRLWILYGVLDFIKSTSPLKINYDFIQNDEQFKFIYDDVKRILNGIRANKSKWIGFFELYDKDREERFEGRLQEIVDVFGVLKTRTNILIEREISEQRIDEQKKGHFLEVLSNNWHENIASYTLFDALKLTRVKDSKEGLNDQPQLGVRYHFLNGYKMAFVEKHGQEIFGVGDIGLRSAKETNNSFLSTIFTNKKSKIQVSSSVRSIETAISRLESRGFKANLIIAPVEFSYKTDLPKSLHFKPSWELGSQETIANLGMYRDIPVFTFYAPILRNQIIISQFEKAFDLEIYEDENLKFKRLHILLREITLKEIDEQFDKDKEKWKKDEVTGVEFTDEEAKTRIKNTMILEMMSFANFNIIDTNAYEVAIIDIEPD